eukprot:69293_1
MASESKSDVESSSLSASDSCSTSHHDSDDNDTFSMINSLITKKKTSDKNTIKKKKRTKSTAQHPYAYPSNYPPSSTFHPPPYPMMYQAPYAPNPHHPQIEEMYQTLLQQIEENKKRKLKRKRKKYIQKQRNIAAHKIQRWWKRYKVVTQFKDPLLNKEIQTLLLNNELANTYLDQLISEYFLTEFVPDLLIEILENNDDTFSSKDVVTQITWSCYEQIEDEICSELSFGICNETINDIVSQYFDSNRNGLQFKSILHRINEEQINEVVLEQCQIVVEESIGELIMEYLIECKSMELFNDLLPNIIERNVNRTLIEYILEKDVVNEYLLNECLDEWIQEIAEDEYEAQTKQISKEKKDKEFDLIEASLVQHLLNEELLNILINKLSTRSQTAFINNQAINLLIHSEMSKILIQKHMDLYQRHKRTTNNIILNETLMELLSDTAIHPFINFLKHAQ